jgi:ribosomal protein L39E
MDIDTAKVARVERQLDPCSHSHSSPQFSQFWAIVFQTLQFDAVVEHNALDGHPQHNVQLAGTRRQWRRQADRLAVPPVSRGIPDAPMGRLQIHIDDPPVEHLAKRAQQNDGVPAGIVVVALQDIAECRPRVPVHQVVTHRALEPFQLALIPGHENLRVLYIGTDL